MGSRSRERSAVAGESESASLFSALGDETRLLLVGRLCAKGPQSIVRLTAGTKLTRQAITKHLYALSDAGLVTSERDGRERIWSLEPARLDVARRYLEHVSARWDAALERLRALVEED